jgi:vanillate O-demethylase ferredoxin subunit
MWSLKPGARLGITLPSSLLAIDWTRRHYCLVAGGIGITPIIGAAQALACRREATFTLHYAVRTREDGAYLDLLTSLLGDRLKLYAGNEGHRIDLDAMFALLPQDAMTLLCGPMRMLDAARHAWSAAGRPLADLRYETFGSSGLLPTESFRVRLKDENVEIEVPRDRSMLDALSEAGYEVMSDCRRGECGVCAIDLVAADGEIDHRDVFFSEHQKRESRKICACVSRARGTITIDTLHRPDAV